MELTAEVANEVLTLMVQDHGVPFDPTQKEDADINAELNERQIGGLGIYLVKSIMDTMTYQRTSDGYNVVTLTKNLSTNQN